MEKHSRVIHCDYKVLNLSLHLELLRLIKTVQMGFYYLITQQGEEEIKPKFMNGADLSIIAL